MGILTALGTLAPIISAGLGLGASAYSTYKNSQANEEANQLTRENLQWQKEKYIDQESYQRQLQEKMFEREDTAYQRTAKDLIGAGYSPLAINGTNDAGTVVSAPSVPELGTINPFQQTALPFGQLTDAINQALDRQNQSRALDIEEQKYLTSNEQKEADRKQRWEELQAQLKQNQEQFDSNMNQRIKEVEKSHSEFAKEMEYKQSQLTLLQDQFKLEQSKVKNQEINETINRLTGGKGTFKEYSNKSEYNVAFESWQTEFSKQLEKASSTLADTPYASAFSGGGKIDVGVPVVKVAVDGQGSNSKSYELLQSVNYEITSWLIKNPVPMYFEN